MSQLGIFRGDIMKYESRIALKFNINLNIIGSIMKQQIHKSREYEALNIAILEKFRFRMHNYFDKNIMMHFFHLLHVYFINANYFTKLYYI